MFGAAAHFMPHDKNESTEIDYTAAKYIGDHGSIKVLGGRLYEYDLISPFVIWKSKD